MRYSMQSYSSILEAGKPTGRSHWTPMEDGPAKSVWKRRKSAQEAVLKCAEWTGLVFIPAMRVVDVQTGSTIWQDRNTTHHHDLDRILPDWTDQVYAAVRRSMAADALVPDSRGEMPTLDLGGLF